MAARTALSSSTQASFARPAANAAERTLRVWPDVVSDMAKWCRSKRAEPLEQRDVPGTNDSERSRLAALGGIALALGAQNIGFDIGSFPKAVQDWLEKAPTPPDHLVNRVRAAFDDDYDPLALVYERIVAGPRRRQLGTFFTPANLLEYMRNVVQVSSFTPRAVADPGAGVGAFTVGALDWWRAAEVHAVDVNLVTLGLLATRPDAHPKTGRSSRSPSRLILRKEDFLEWLGSSWPEISGPRLIMGNPPYTRHQQLSASEKKAAQAAAGDLTPGSRAGLSTYFLAASLQALGPRDALCLLLPANWLEADYAESVRRHLWSQHLRPVGLHLFPNEFNIFPGAQVSAMVLFVGPTRKTRQPIKVFEVLENAEGRLAPERLALRERSSTPPPNFTRSAMIRASPKSTEGRDQSGIPLARIAAVRRGVATGANSFFLRTTAEVERLPRESFRPAITRLRDLPGDILDDHAHASLAKAGTRCWILSLDTTIATNEAIKEILESGVRAGIHQRYLCKVRSLWYQVERIPTPDLFIGPMGKSSFRVVVNKVGATPTNTLYGIRLRQRGALAAQVHLLATWLKADEGQASLRSVARQHGDGLLKFEPRALAAIKLPIEIAGHILDIAAKGLQTDTNDTEVQLGTAD